MHHYTERDRERERKRETNETDEEKLNEKYIMLRRDKLCNRASTKRTAWARASTQAHSRGKKIECAVRTGQKERKKDKGIYFTDW